MAARCILEKSLTSLEIERGLSLERCLDKLPGAGKTQMKLKVSDGERVWEFDYILRQKPGFYGGAWDEFATAANLRLGNIVRLYAEEANGAKYRIEVIRL